MGDFEYSNMIKATPQMQDYPPKNVHPPGPHVIIIGNGFDKFIGRPTTYAEFYESDYCPKNYPAPLIQYLNGISGDGKAAKFRWYDFENELLKYSTDLNFHEDPLSSIEKQVLKKIIKSGFYLNGKQPTEQIMNEVQAQNSLVNKHLLERDQFGVLSYVFGEFYDNIVERDKEAFSLIKEGLVAYLNSVSQVQLKPEIEQKIKVRLGDFGETHRIVYTFNYTQFPSIGTNEIHYVHGSCQNNDIVLGTREEKAIEKDYWFVQKLFDTNYRPAYVLADLFNADRVTIFGHSLGENDRQYFEAFFKRQCNPEKAKKDLPITIYTKDQEAVMEIKHSLQELTDYHLSDLLQNSKLDIVTTDSI